MSFSSDYLELRKKKKKTEEETKTTGHSFTDEFLSLQAESTKKNNTVPTPTVPVTAPLFSRFRVGDIAPVLTKTDKEEEDAVSNDFDYTSIIKNRDFLTKSKTGLTSFYNSKKAAQESEGSKSIWQRLLENNARSFSMQSDNPAVYAMNTAAQHYREDTSYKEPTDEWTDEQKNIFGYLYAEDKARSWEYAEMVNNSINKAKTDEQRKLVEESATKHFGSGVGHTIASLILAPTAIADIADNAIEYANRGTITEKGMLTPFDYTQAATGGISNKLNEMGGTISEDVPVIGGKGFGDLYSLGYSAAQSLTYGSMGSSTLTKAIFFGQAGASGIDEKLAAGGTAERAMLYGLVSGAAEAAAESYGIDNLFKNSTAKTFKGLLKNMLKQGVSEGMEESLTSVVNNVADSLIMGEKSNYSKAVAEYEKTMSAEDAKRQALKDVLEDIAFDALGGMITGTTNTAVMTGVNSIKNSTQGKDAITGLTKNEKAVVDKVYKDRVAEAEESGKISDKEKSKIYDDVLSDMEKGYISTDTIEDVLGDRSSFDSLQKEAEEYDTLYNTASGQLSKAQQDRLTELETKNKANPYKDALKTAKDQYSQSVFDLVKSDRLSESYNERGRRSQTFEADLTQYDAKQQQTIQKAIDSGILNNTRRTHEFVDMIAKISADKGVLFDFTNNTKLKESGFAVDGKTVNGYVTKDGVTLNIDSKKSLNSVVGHEITHVLEGTELYDLMKQTVFEYAKTKGEYDSRFKALTETYKDIDADIEAELAADLVGDYLFTDSDFINRLSTEHRNVFQKIYDEVKYLCKVVTAGSKEARELEKVKKAFEDAYRASGTDTSGTKYSVSDTDGKQLSKEQQEYFKDSKMRDENGNLKVMYHGSQDAGFHVFDPKMSDDDTSFFFVDRNDVAASYSGTTETYEAKTIRTAEDMNNFLAEIGHDEDYSVVEKDGKFELLYDGERVAGSDTAQGIYKEFCWYEGVGEGDANYKVYLNLKNPLEVDAKGRPWNKIDAEFSQEVYDRYQSLTAEEKAALVDLAEWEDFRIFNSEIQEARDNELASAYQKMGEDVNIYDLFSVASDNFSEEAMRENARKYLKTRDYAQRAKEKGYDGVIFKNIVDNGGYSNGDEGASTVAIAFDSNQIKSTANAKPTADPDIRYSLSADSEGRKLSENQAKYFKNSKVTDENGNLKVVYHGSLADFNTFSLEYLGTNGTAEGYGFYFTDKKSIAENYSRGHEGQQNGESGKLFEVYLDIKKPLSDTEVTMTRAQFKKFLTTLNKQVDADGEPLDVLSNYGDVEWEGLNKVLNYAMEIEYDGSDSDVNLVHSIINGCGNMQVVFDVLRKTVGYDGIIVNEASWGGDQTIYIAFHPEQIKNVDNLNPTSDHDIRKSLSGVEQTKRYGRYNVSGKDIALETAKTEQNVPKAEDVAPVTEETNANPNTNATQNANPNATVTQEEMQELFPDDLAPTQTELDTLLEEKEALESRMLDMANSEDFTEFDAVTDRYGEVMTRIGELEKEVSQTESDRVNSIDDADAPPEMEAPIASESVTVDDPFYDREYSEVGKDRKTKAYMYENPEVKPYFQEAASIMLWDFQDSTRGERWYNDELYYESGGEKGFGGVKRHTSKDIEELLDSWGMSYDDIEKGLKAIIEDNGAENIAAAKHIEFMLNRRLLHGYEDFHTGQHVPANQGYIDTLNEIQSNQHAREEFENFLPMADAYAPPATEEAVPENVAPVAEEAPVITAPVEDANGQQAMYKEAFRSEAIRPKPQKEPRMARATPEEQATAEILTEEPKVEKKKRNLWTWAKEHILDSGMVFEDLALESGNRELQARWNSIRYSESKAQRLMGKGTDGVKSLNAIREEVEKTGKVKQFYSYLYHKHNVDRMTLETRYKDTPNKPVFGSSVTAEESQKVVDMYEAKFPAFKNYAKDVYDYMGHLRQQLVDNGVISSETAKLWAEMYPNYVPIRRLGDEGLNINVPLDTGRTGVNAPVKRAKGGNRDILPLFDTMGQRTIQTYKAIAKNRFGVELKNTLGTTIANEETSVDDTIDSIDTHDGLLQKGDKHHLPTFTVFENGEKVTFEITDEMYDAMKPASDVLSSTSKTLNTISNIRRGTLTEYNPWFMLKNAVKDIQDVLINSQHAAKTYAAVPKAIKQMATNGHWYQEYMDNGGDQNSYFDSQENTFKPENTALEKAKKVFGLNAISKANNIIERLPRLAEYIASRESGQSVDVAMLDAARVTTNFAAGGDLTKFLNRNGVTFLNASVQGAVQQARNIREAKVNGLKGWANLAAKYVAAGLPAMLLNHLIWEDDEEYEELSDYVKQNYYIVGKYGDGQFVRIPKGRTVAVIQNGFEQMKNLITGNDEADLSTFLDLVVTNLAPNNPLDNNIISPVVDVVTNEAWYGGDLVPTRLQDLPAAEQYDESTDAISRWLGETFNVSPYKANYLLDQYSGVVGDTFLPMLTTEAESGDNSFLGNMIAPLKDMFTTDSVMNNQNVSDFYDLKDELAVIANGSGATDEDILMSKYLNSVSGELSKLYSEKREVQNSDLSDEEKYAAVREIQEQIVSITKEGLGNYEDISFEDEYRGGGEYARVGDRLYKLSKDGQWQKLSDEQATKYEVTSAAGDSSYATDGSNHYRWYVPGEDAAADAEPEWRKITDDQLEKQEEVTSGLGISPEEYWGNKEEYDYAYEYPESYAVSKAVGGYNAYRTYSSELYDIKADKDENGKSISGSRKEKVHEYIFGLDAEYGEKIILFKNEYNADDTYNYEIIDYLNGREDISYEEMETILKKLGFTVNADGTIEW